MLTGIDAVTGIVTEGIIDSLEIGTFCDDDAPCCSVVSGESEPDALPEEIVASPDGAEESTSVSVTVIRVV